MRIPRRRSRRAPALVPAAVLALALTLVPATTRAAACDPSRATLETPDGRRIEIAVELAATPQARSRGLMERTRLEPGTGMLFVYPTPQRVAFWMRNTLIPLDMLFFTPSGRLAHLHAGAVPHDETPIPGAGPDDAAPERLMVLEVAGGEAARLGITEGSTLAHAALDPSCNLVAE